MSVDGDNHDLDRGLEGNKPASSTESFAFEETSENIAQSHEPLRLELEIYVRGDRSELLVGLERWLELNLIGQAEVKQIARRYLCCALPTPPVESIAPLKPEVTKEAVKTSSDFSQLFARIVRNFLAELSIRWLLFLGILLVTVSSGVLAVSYWQNFPIIGQYLVLLVYSLGFWVVAGWTRKQRLKLTAQTLEGIATLLVPINFWAMDRLQLNSSPTGWMAIGVAATVLTAAVVSRKARSLQNTLFSFLFLLLCCLHLGWSIALVNPLSIYGGIILVASACYRYLPSLSAANLFNVLFAWSLLLARKLIDSPDFTPNYCLAIAICAWLIATFCLTRLPQKTIPERSRAVVLIFFSHLGQICSIVLFCLTWSISIVESITTSPLFLWQALGINALAVDVFARRLTLYWRKRDLTAILAIFWQTIFIGLALIPSQIRARAIELAIAISNTAYFPESVLGVILFPEIIFCLAIAGWLYRRQQTALAWYTEYLTLMLGIVLTALSLSNPMWRSLNLLFSTLTLAYVTRVRQPIRTSLLYFTHLLGLTTILNAIAMILPDLNLPLWGTILTVLTIGEWCSYLSLAKRVKSKIISLWQQSCWYCGLLLAGASFICFLFHVRATPTSSTFGWELIWLIVPATLTLIARRTRQLGQRHLATVLSCIALVLAQALVWGQFSTRTVGLTTGVWLMYLNVFQLRRLVIVIIHLGFGLCLIAQLLDVVVGGWNWLPIGAVAIFGLYRLRQSWQRTLDNPKFSYISQRQAHGLLGVGSETQNFKLVSKYIKAANYWAIALIAVEVVSLGVLCFYLANDLYFSYLLTICLLAVTILWRFARQPNNFVLYILTALGELFIIGLLKLLGISSLLAIANVGMGLVASVVVGKLRRTDSPWTRLNLAFVPLVYALGGIFWRLTYINAYTGLLTLGTAVILIDTRQSNHRLDRLVKRLGLAGISWGIYESVVYYLLSASDINTVDSLTILASVTAAIAFSYRFAAWRYCQHSRFHLVLGDLVSLAHLHWAVGSILKLVGASMAINGTTSSLTPVSIATSFFLGAYALLQGRRDENPSEVNDGWVYVGIVELTATLIYSRLIISQLSLFDPGRVVFTCAIALLIYYLPWQDLGWRAKPWQHSAMVLPALITLVTAEDISYFSLSATALFYLRLAYTRQNMRWSYLSLAAVNWGIVRLVWQNNLEFTWLIATIGLSLLYIAQFDPYYRSRRRPRHFLRIVGSGVISLVALSDRSGIISGVVSFCFIFVGLGLRIRAFLFTGTITLIINVVYQLVILAIAYSFFKWTIALIAGIAAIVIAAGFERQRESMIEALKKYGVRLKNWQ